MSRFRATRWLATAGMVTALCASPLAFAEEQSSEKKTAQVRIISDGSGKAIITAGEPAVTATIKMSKDGVIEVQTKEAVVRDLGTELKVEVKQAAEKDCTEKECPEGDCPDAKAKASTLAVSAKTDEEDLSSAGSEAELGTPTHHQTKIIKANQEELENTKLNCFCMTLDGRILGGCGSTKDNGEIRVFDSEGNYVESWKTPVKVEAINVRASDGNVFVAGNGKLVMLDDKGSILLEKDSPHVDLSDEEAAKMREVVINQHKSRIKMYANQSKIYDQQIVTYEEKLAELQTKLEELPAEENDEEEGKASVHELIEKQIAQQERMLKSMTRAKEMMAKRIEMLGDSEPSDEEIDRQVEAQISRKMAVASISAVDDKVYLACSMAVGYGYCVWSVSEDFESGKQIVGDLSGCCGQMDVQANSKGIYVAENSRDRVVCFDHEGEKVTEWGHSARSGIRGFGSCCNPMNVAFGPENTVYTAESGTGRIKQYSSKGELLQVIGSADLVPGCKKVSIGVAHDGNRVFMLDITRDHIVMMDRIPADERAEMVAAAKAKEEAVNEGEEESVEKQTTATTVDSFLGGLLIVPSE